MLFSCGGPLAPLQVWNQRYDSHRNDRSRNPRACSTYSMWISDKTLTCSQWDREQQVQEQTHYASVEFQIDFCKSCRVEHPKAHIRETLDL